MNNLGLQAGGHRLYKEDFDFLQAALVEAITGLGSAFGTNCILSGCQLSIDGAGPGWLLTQGYVVLGGEIFKVEPATYASEPTVPVWVLVESNDAIDPILYADGSSYNVHNIRKATVEHFTGQPTISGYTTARIDYGNNLRTLTPVSSWIAGSLPTSDLKYYREGRHINFLGNITYDGAFPAAASPFFILPNAFRPLYNGFYWGVVGDTYAASLLDGAGTVPEMGWIYINTAGECYADPNHISAGKNLNLSGIRFLAA